MKTLVGAMILLASIKAVAETSDDEIHLLLRFCPPEEKMSLKIVNEDRDSIKAGVSTEYIQNIVEARLRTARIYDEDSSPYLMQTAVQK